MSPFYQLQGQKPEADTAKDTADILVVLAAGINTKDSLNKKTGLFHELYEELMARYGGRAKIIVTYPLGVPDDPLDTAEQAAMVGMHMLQNTGGKSLADEVEKNIGNATKVVLIGHSGGGQAVGDALEELERRGIKVHHALIIGAPKDKIKKKYLDRVTRIDAPTDIVPNLVTIRSVTGLFGLLSPKEGLLHAMGQALTSGLYAYPETIVVPIAFSPEDPTGGHSAYFTRKNGNLTLWLDKVWDRIK